MNDIGQELVDLIRARYPLVYLVTSEEQRALEELQEIADGLDKRLIVWSITRGLVDAASGHAEENTADPLLGLDKIMSTPASGANLYVLLDFHVFLEKSQGVAIRKLRDTIHHLSGTHSSLFILSPILRIPPEAEKETTVIDYPLPSREQLRAVLDDLVASNPAAEVQLSARDRESMIEALLGLTAIEAENVLSRALINDRRLDEADIGLIVQEKEQIIKKSGVLEFYSLQEGFEDVGGLELLKEWLRSKRRTFGEEALRFGLPVPRGVFLMGVPGCGKSLTAKAVAQAWKMPLLRFDLGKVFGMYVGESESNIRLVIRTAESIAPCVLWIDEIEKGFSGVGSGALDSGVSARVFGSFITWLQEKKSPVYVVATANDIRHLPPELMRKGRFDEIFFLDLPVEAEREQIFAVHISARRREPATFDLAALAKATEGFSGADIGGSRARWFGARLHRGRARAGDERLPERDRRDDATLGTDSRPDRCASGLGGGASSPSEPWSARPGRRNSEHGREVEPHRGGTVSLAKLRLHDRLAASRANGPGARAVLWCQGCTLACPGCFNPETHSHAEGELHEVGELLDWLAGLEESIEGVTLSGGEPLQQPQAVAKLVRGLEKTTLSTVLFTGYEWQEALSIDQGPEILAKVDAVVSGRYDQNAHRVNRALVGSGNQRLHLVSSRYRLSDFDAVPPTELVIDSEGRTTITGIDPLSTSFGGES